MLKLYKIKKDYIMKDLESVHALKGITVCFRRNEFVAILGPSGCGKTTLLNIIGGLDKYTSGNLLIEGKSTKKYGDRDWDTYRNHSVGFVFQSYNLINHQSVLKNVELALTISGVSKKERRERATEALRMVGLAGSEKKKPNQLSGGQMQRVAIARALVNNPEILLADEPTGALDSETSIQIMDLLKKVANDRLVVMVTHNPDLANQYANRIITMKDGLLTSDSNFYSGEKPEERAEVLKNKNTNKGRKEKTSMSFFTAMGLSLSNLFSKSKRTVLVAIAGSIGIFGVSTVLAASTGVRRYIDDMQDDMLSSYPLQIAEEAVDYTSLMTGLYSDPDSKIKEFDTSTRVGLNSMIDYLMDKYTDITSVKTNTINHDLVQFVKEIPEEYLFTTSYSYAIDPTNNIFTSWAPKEGDPEISISLNGLTQRYISELTTVEGFSQYANYVDLFTDFMQLLPDGLNDDGVFDEKDYAYISSQYDLLGNSRFPENENEIMLVVESDTTLTDLVFAQMGYYHEEELMNIAKHAIKKYAADRIETDEELEKKYPYTTSYSYEELLNKKFMYYPHDTIYSYKDVEDSGYNEYSIVLTKTGTNDEFYSLTYADNTTSSLIKGIIFTGTHIKLNPISAESVYMIRMSDDFSPAAMMGGDDVDLASLIADPADTEDPTTGTFLCIPSTEVRKLLVDSSSIDMSAISLVNIQGGNETTATVNYMSQFDCKKEVIDQTAITAYQYPAEADPSWTGGVPMKIAGILRPKKGVSFGCLRRGVYYTREFQEKYMNDALNSKIIRGDNGFTKFIENGGLKSSTFNAYVTFEYPDWTDPDNPNYHATGFASCLNGDLNSSFSSLFSSITGVDYEQENQTHFRSLCGLKIFGTTDSNTKETSYQYEKLPETMSIYPIDFNTKSKVNDYLDQWNKDVDITLYDGSAQQKVLHQADRDELTYTDTISLIINVIDTMITIITTALVIFTSLSLVVSSFMIAVITYISVMDRVKEIGVIRSLGGRKKDVSRLFIAENLITGVLSGILGLIVTEIVCIIINLVIGSFGVPSIAVLTIPIALIMLGLSVALSVLAGLIPSMHASRQDPVVALRTE